MSYTPRLLPWCLLWGMDLSLSRDGLGFTSIHCGSWFLLPSGANGSLGSAAFGSLRPCLAHFSSVCLGFLLAPWGRMAKVRCCLLFCCLRRWLLPSPGVHRVTGLPVILLCVSHPYFSGS